MGSINTHQWANTEKEMIIETYSKIGTDIGNDKDEGKCCKVNQDSRVSGKYP